MAILKFLKQTAASVLTPAANYISLFFDSADGYMKYRDETGTLNILGTVSATLPLVATGGILSIPQATTSVDGYFSHTDFTSFSNTQSALANSTGSSTSTQAITAATLTLVNGSVISRPTAGFTVGQTYRWNVIMSKTAAGTAASTIAIRAGTTGTTSDAVVASFATGTGTAVIDTAAVEVILTISTLGTSGTAISTLTLCHNLNTTGWSTATSVVVVGTMTALNTSTVTFLSMSITSGASVVPTIQQCVVEIVKF